MPAKIDTFSDEEFKQIVAESHSLIEIAKKTRLQFTQWR